MATFSITFQGNPVYNDWTGTILVCWGLDCETATWWFQDEIRVLTGTSRWWSADGRAAYTWAGYPLVLQPHEFGIIHANNGFIVPAWTFGVPTNELRIQDYAAKVRDRVYPDREGLPLDDPRVPTNLSKTIANLRQQSE
ncbi:MAG: hypothetical protein ACJ76Y_00880 [Thermoanaerobaculia bacterium]